jgi:hypothetical protein
MNNYLIIIDINGALELMSAGRKKAVISPDDRSKIAIK